jgi:uncharacterized membrane protein
MSTLIAIVFEDPTKAFEMRTALLRMEKQHLVDLEDSVVVLRDDKGKIKLDQAMSLTSVGAVGGGFWGMLIGLIFLNPLLGAAVGAAAGAISAKLTDIGVDDKMMKDMATSLHPGRAALFVLVRRVTADKVLEGLKEFAGKGKIYQTSLSKDDETTLRAALEAA